MSFNVDMEFIKIFSILHHCAAAEDGWLHVVEFDPQNETFFDMNICISMSFSDTSSGVCG